MPQEFQVLRCYACHTFQVHQVKKAKKWNCKICGEKQSVIKVFGRGTGAECRQHTQKLNMTQGEMRETAEALEGGPQEFHDEDCSPVCPQDDTSRPQTMSSRWSVYLEDEAADETTEASDSCYTTDWGEYRSQKPVQRLKRQRWSNGESQEKAISGSFRQPYLTKAKRKCNNSSDMKMPNIAKFPQTTGVRSGISWIPNERRSLSQTFGEDTDRGLSETTGEDRGLSETSGEDRSLLQTSGAEHFGRRTTPFSQPHYQTKPSRLITSNVSSHSAGLWGSTPTFFQGLEDSDDLDHIPANSSNVPTADPAPMTFQDRKALPFGVKNNQRTGQGLKAKQPSSKPSSRWGKFLTSESEDDESDDASSYLEANNDTEHLSCFTGTANFSHTDRCSESDPKNDYLLDSFLNRENGSQFEFTNGSGGNPYHVTREKGKSPENTVSTYSDCQTKCGPIRAGVHLPTHRMGDSNTLGTGRTTEGGVAFSSGKLPSNAASLNSAGDKSLLTDKPALTNHCAPIAPIFSLGDSDEDCLPNFDL